MSECFQVLEMQWEIMVFVLVIRNSESRNEKPKNLLLVLCEICCKVNLHPFKERGNQCVSVATRFSVQLLQICSKPEKHKYTSRFKSPVSETAGGRLCCPSHASIVTVGVSCCWGQVECGKSER